MMRGGINALAAIVRAGSNTPDDLLDLVLRDHRHQLPVGPGVPAAITARTERRDKLNGPDVRDAQ
jgi:hypothetical protein